MLSSYFDAPILPTNFLQETVKKDVILSFCKSNKRPHYLKEKEFRLIQLMIEDGFESKGAFPHQFLSKDRHKINVTVFIIGKDKEEFTIYFTDGFGFVSNFSFNSKGSFCLKSTINNAKKAGYKQLLTPVIETDLEEVKFCNQHGFIETTDSHPFSVGIWYGPHYSKTL